MVGRFVLMVVALLCLSAFSGAAVSAQREGTFTLSVGAANCDSDPHQHSDAICAPAGGVVINVALESGEAIGSCTMKISYPPSGGVTAGCGVEEVPFNSTLIISEDPASLPEGYEPLESPQTFVTTDVIPGGGEGPVISFTNVLQPDSGGAPPAVYRTTNLYGGTCDAPDTQTGYYPLSPVVMAQGEAVGQSIAIEAESGYQTVNIPLDTIIDEPHIIAVHETLRPESPIIACGEIGGVNDHDGELVIGLKEMNNSGFTGIARFSYNPDDGQKTDVAVYIAQGLSAGTQ